MESSTLTLRTLTPVDWTVLRKVRLEALRDSPHAFMARHEHEQLLAESDWRGMFSDATWVVAQEVNVVVGVARSVVVPEQPRVRYLESLWVAPARRRRGVLRGLVHELARIERRAGVTHLLLWVMEDNHPARRCYAAVGFQPTGERQFLPELGRFEVQLQLRITR